MNTITADQKYRAHLDAINDLLAGIKSELTAHAARFEECGRTDWSLVGDLGYIRETLSELDDFMTIEEHINHV